MHDAINLTKKGIPAVVIVTEKFENEAEAIAQKFGIIQPPMIIVSHPFAILSSAELDQLVNENLDSIVKILLGKNY